MRLLRKQEVVGSSPIVGSKRGRIMDAIVTQEAAALEKFIEYQLMFLGDPREWCLVMQRSTDGLTTRYWLERRIQKRP